MSPCVPRLSCAFRLSFLTRCVTVAGSLWLFWPTSARAGTERADTSSLNQFRKKIAPLEKTNPAQVPGLYEQFLREHPDLNPNVAVLVQSLRIGALHALSKDPEKTLALYDSMIATASQPGSNISTGALLILVRGKAGVLSEARRYEEETALWRDNLGLIITGAQGAGPSEARGAARMAFSYSVALKRSGRSTEFPAIAARLLREVPGLLDGQQQQPEGFLYGMLVTGLLAEKKPDEALQWAKLQYMLCPFEQAALERSTQLLTQAWAGQDNFPAIAAFGKAQQEAGAPNPLATVKLPELPRGVLAAQWERLQQDMAKVTRRDPVAVREINTMYLATGQFGLAMQEAQRLLRERPEAVEGASEVARVFKAADLNVLRANRFLAFLKGEGNNPFPEFYQQYPPVVATTEQGSTGEGATGETTAPATQQ